MRLTLALAAAAGVGVVGALVLGEYPFEGLTVLVAGVVFGLFIGEAALAVARRTSVGLGVGCAGIGLAAMTWAAWIASGRDLSFLGTAGWASIVVAGAVTGLRTGWSRREGDSPPAAPARARSPEERPA